MKSASRAWFQEALKHSDIKVLILNGKQVVKEYERVIGHTLPAQHMPEWSLPRKGTKPVMGMAYMGSLDEQVGRKSHNGILVLGFNHNIQSSFGISLKIRKAIRSWITTQSEEAF